MSTESIVGTLISSGGTTTDGSNPVLIGTFLPAGTASATAVLLFINGIKYSDDATASAILALTVNSASDGYHVISRTDLVPIRTGSSLALQGCQVSISVNASGVNVYVIGVIATTITWSAYLTGSSIGEI